MYFVVIVFLSNCAKEKTGDLSITYLDERSDPIMGAEVFIYDSQDNFDKALYFTSLRTNSEGVVVFTRLTPQIYYFDVTHKRPGGFLQTLKG